jgi:hypothetical protein
LGKVTTLILLSSKKINVALFEPRGFFFIMAGASAADIQLRGEFTGWA